jgi:hypothetical protein
MVSINFFAFWMLTTYSIATGDYIGLLLAVGGFLFMHSMIEDHQKE